MKPDRLSEILPHGLTPRLLTKGQAAAYCGVSSGTFDAWIERGLMPGPVRGTRQFDRKAIDMALDNLSGLRLQSTISALDEWRARRGKGADQRA